MYLIKNALLIVHFLQNIALLMVQFSIFVAKISAMDINLVHFMKSRVDLVTTSFHRYLYSQIDWGRQMLGLVGPRGVGKTTMFLQYIKEHQDTEKMFYVSADYIYFSSHSLIELADEFSKAGGEYLFIDEIHKYKGWAQELKQIYDTHIDMKVAFTGSSVLDIIQGGADLSRRVPVYHLQGLSFREYLELFKGITVPTYSLDEIIRQKALLPDEISSHPLPLFKEYLRQGYYPFGNDSEFSMLLNQSLNLTMEVDIPQFANMTPSTTRKLKKLLAVISRSVPFKPVMDSLATVIGVSRNTLPDYFLYMEKAGVISQLRDATGGIRGLGKVDKVYLDNTNLAYILGGGEANVGNIRETFFYNQLRVNHDVMVSRISDFEIDDITFEVGGKNKSQRQITEATDGYVVKDDIEVGAGNIIPLWAFGLNY